MSGLGRGFRVGHWSDAGALTGCTVVLPPPGNVASCDVRGSSPGSRELELLDPNRRLTEIHAVVLTGGSAFGLAAATGVVEWLERRGIGYRTPVATVPIVPAAVIFDLAAGSAGARPGPADGAAACDVASETLVASGRVGVGTGATVGKWAGRDHAAPGGVGIARVEESGLVVSALAVANSVGDVVAADGSVIAGTTHPAPAYRPPLPADAELPQSTVLAVVASDATLAKADARWLAARGSDGITTAIRPAHTRYDGDVVFAIAAGARPTSPRDLDVLGYLATRAVAGALRASVGARPI